MSKIQTNNSKVCLNGATSTSALNIYTVNLVKREYGGFGFLIRQRNEIPYFSIWEIIKNGAAETNGQIRKGDIILKVNKEDLSKIGYERGLEILKAIKPGCCVELTMQSAEGTQQESIDLVDFSTHHHLNNKSAMSPLQRLKKRFTSCATTPTTAEKINGTVGGYQQVRTLTNHPYSNSSLNAKKNCGK